MSKPNPTTAKKLVPAKPARPKDAAAAFAEVRAEIEALPETDLASVNVNVPRAVALVLGALPNVLALRERVVVELPKLPIRYVDHLRAYALAAWYTHLAALPPLPPEDTARGLMEEGTPLRESLLVAAEALAFRGFFDKAKVAEIRGGDGYVDHASDLVALSALFSEHWTAIENKTAVEWAEIERAADLGPAILVALGERDVPNAKTEEIAALRERAVGLLLKAYDQCRRAAAYLCWGERDLDEIAPSLRETRDP